MAAGLVGADAGGHDGDGVQGTDDHPDHGRPDGELLRLARGLLGARDVPAAYLPLTCAANTIEAMPSGRQQKTVDRIAHTR